MRDLAAHVESGGHLSAEQVEAAVELLLSSQTDEADKGAFLTALRSKGETGCEMAAFARSMLKRAIDPQISPQRLPGPILDVCGTGGDRLELFNVSTTSVFVLAAGGAAVVKHGNRGISSRSGGADVLEALGIEIEASPAALRESMERIGIGFIFAPHYHPAFKIIGPLRKKLAARGVTTIFNLLGPLLNPARPAYQLVGVFARGVLANVAEALRLLGRKHAWAVHGLGPAGEGMDEISSLGPTDVIRAQEGVTDAFSISPSELGIPPAEIRDLQGGDREENARMLIGILDGSIRGPKRDVVILNAAAGFVVAGLASDLPRGMDLANAAIDGGNALRKLRLLQEFAP